MAGKDDKFRYLDRDEYINYRRNRKPGDPYFPEGTFHEDEYFFWEEKVFVWDEPKNEANKIDHGIDFYTAAYVFNDDDMLEERNKSEEEEQRKQTTGEPMEPSNPKHPIDTRHSRPRAVIGELNGILFVVFVEEYGSYGQMKRIISARAANQDEVKAYFYAKWG